MKYKICFLLTILGSLFILSCNKKYYYFYSNKEDFIQQVKSHQDTERVYTKYDIVGGVLYNLLSLLIDGKTYGDEIYWRYSYCNYKKYYYFYDMKTKVLDTIKGEPDYISTVIIYKKDGSSRELPLDGLKIINDSLLGSMYYYNNKLMIRKKRAIKLNEIDSIIYRVSESDYISKKYRYKPTSTNCIEHH